MPPKKIICVVTPCFNAEKYIADTIRSIIGNSAISNGQAEIHYVISDGQSKDRTVEIAQQIAETADSNNIHFHIQSEPDQGLYDAVAKGFALCPPGDIYCYLGAGDYLSPYAFQVILDIFDRGYNWITGLKTDYNDASHLISMRLPHTYRRRLIKSGFYGSWLRFIQQESTFWSAQLHKKLDFDQLRQYRLAGDYYMWKTFAQYEKLYVVQAWLGGFRRHPNQLTSDLNPYRKELYAIRDKPAFFDYFLAVLDKIISFFPEEVIAVLDRKHILSYNPATGRYE